MPEVEDREEKETMEQGKGSRETERERESRDTERD